jgi:hypothetical protein
MSLRNPVGCDATRGDVAVTINAVDQRLRVLLTQSRYGGGYFASRAFARLDERQADFRGHQTE